MINPKEIQLSAVLERALQYMKETETAARRSCGYPKDLERCLQFQLEQAQVPEAGGKEVGK